MPINHWQAVAIGHEAASLLPSASSLPAAGLPYNQRRICDESAQGDSRLEGRGRELSRDNSKKIVLRLLNGTTFEILEEKALQLSRGTGAHVYMHMPVAGPLEHGTPVWTDPQVFKHLYTGQHLQVTDQY